MDRGLIHWDGCAGSTVFVTSSRDAGSGQCKHSGQDSLPHGWFLEGADRDTIDPPYSFPARAQGSQLMLFELRLEPELVDMAPCGGPKPGAYDIMLFW